jgi:hypothetical protein
MGVGHKVVIMNDKLRDELISMAKEDSKVLQELVDNGKLCTVEYHPKMKAVHEKNNKRIKEIIEKYGWPGNSIVGKDAANAAWYIVQHAVSDTIFMNTCLPLLKNAVKHQEAELFHFAYLQDRVLTMAGKPQIYGTQHDIDNNGKAFPLPIKNPENVDALRKEMGLEPLSEATKRIQERHNTIISNHEESGQQGIQD